MNNKLKMTVASAVISVSLLGSSIPAYTIGSASAAEQAVASYKLTEVLDVELKSVLNESVSAGTRLGVVIRLKNNGAKVTRVPDYEVRVKTSEGIEYKLQPSAGNVKSIQPKAKTELSYMTVVDRTDEITLDQVNWTDVDYYVYPKKETLIVGVPIQGVAWKGADASITDPAAMKKWNDTFVIPGLLSPLQYTPQSIQKESTPQGTVHVVKLLVTNATNKRETVPAFQVDAKGDGKTFSGERVEKTPITLEPNEQKYVHYAIPTDQDAVIDSLNVLTQEKFQSAGEQGPGGETSFAVGKLNVLLPTEESASAYPALKLGSVIPFDPNSKLIHPNMAVSVVEFAMSDDTEAGNKALTAKFKLTNQSDRPIAVPMFLADLVSADGYQYEGSRQQVTTPYVSPGSSLTVNYFFALPASESGKGLALKVQDVKTAAPYKSTIAAFATELQPADEKEAFSLYPFDVDVKHWHISADMGPTTNYRYMFRLKLDLDIERDPFVQLDSSFSTLLFELYDSEGRLVGTANGSMFGVNRLASAENTISFNAATESFNHPMMVRVYETYQTPSGLAKRLLTELKQ
ncbi:hypothetical protein [Paenibacillus sp. YYML68]|uniref:hypothetical protein n=1 Tax=Paenibacillus sp. YYML68 TaxID=2909250 RepID=UPI00248F985F|nr:hypothetical protein [Paenibacillus sp. YYML68]